jgi:hypothetical protein
VPRPTTSTRHRRLPRGQVVLLGAGTYTLASGIDFANHSNVTLRGAGADKTFLIFTQGDDRKGKGSDGTDADIRIENFDASLPHYEDHSAGPRATAPIGPTATRRARPRSRLSSTANLDPGQEHHLP